MRWVLPIALLGLICCSIRGYGDGEQGILRTGGITDFMLQYPGDSSSLRKLQILDEKVAIQVYHGFAVVKAQYKLVNTSNDQFSIPMGYPVNSSYSTENNSVTSSILFDQLYAMESYTNGKENMVARIPVDSTQPQDDVNWYIWIDTFKAKDTTTISAYFIVNTNNAEIIRDNKHASNNTFLYIMGANAAWKRPIVKGEVKIELMDNLKIADIKGFLPPAAFKVDEERKTLVWQFGNFSPKSDDNVVLVYTPNITLFDFSYVSQRRLALFGSVDALFQQNDNDLKLTDHPFDSPYKAQKVNWVTFIWLWGYCCVRDLWSNINCVAIQVFAGLYAGAKKHQEQLGFKSKGKSQNLKVGCTANLQKQEQVELLRTYAVRRTATNYLL